MKKLMVVLINIFILCNISAQTSISPDTINNWYIATSKYTRMENYTEALKYCNMLISVEPRNCKYIGLKGAILKSMKNFDESELILMQGLEYGCDSVKFFLMLANGQFSQDNYKKALEYNWEAIKIRPDSAELYIKRATIYSIIDDKENDIKCLQKAKSLGSKRAEELLEILEHPGK